MKLLVIDNYDSFTYNLVQALGTLGVEILVRRNDRIGLEEVALLRADRIVISPGPNRPQDAGISLDIIRTFGPDIPILGVCLGMQCINEAYGGITVKATIPTHGKTSTIYHHGKGLYKGMHSPFQAARYHSLMCSRIPSCLETDAWTTDHTPMGLRHKGHPVVGVQFHPESFMTERGEQVLANFLNGSY
jgi:anthranilate synthase/aminodeoxychorismate synthase-like glutamine amidotransferase